MSDKTHPRFPLYVVSYDRHDKTLTTDALDEMGVGYHVVIEPEQYDDYAKHFAENKLLTVPEKYHEDYDTYDDLGREKSQGPGPARNFAWDHSEKKGYNWHWVMDDNITHFYRFHDNQIIRMGDGSNFRAMEDFVLQYENVSMAGPNYEMFVMRKKDHPPLVFNTRIYSCNLIRNDVPYQWAGRYNEDTDLSLRMLKDGWVTVQFNTFLQDKVATQTVGGGNTENFYSKEGTYPKTAMQKQQHPVVTEVVHKWGRWHHEIDYSPFKKNELKRKEDSDIEVGDYNYSVVEKD